MSQAIIDPAELRRFAQNLKRFTAELQDQISVLSGQFSGLGDTWRDQEHAKFAEEFQQTLQVITRFIQASEEHVPFLVRKAERIEDYLQQR